jgi:hypothetical protein
MRGRLVKAFDDVLEAFPLDQAHRIEGPAVGVMPQSVDRHDAGMLQPARDLGFDQETRSAVLVVRMALLDFLERHLAIQLVIVRDRNQAQAPLGVQPKDAKARPGWIGVRSDGGRGGRHDWFRKFTAAIILGDPALARNVDARFAGFADYCEACKEIRHLNLLIAVRTMDDDHTNAPETSAGGIVLRYLRPC